MNIFRKSSGGTTTECECQREQGYSYEKIKAIADHIIAASKHRPLVGIICGSGLGTLADKLVDSEVLPYESIPNFPVTTVPFHAGRLVLGLLNGIPVVCMQGRIHYYEGHPLWKCALSVRVMKLMGIENLIVTNAAGGLNENFKIGDIVVFKDHIDLQNYGGNSVLRGINEPRFGPQYLDLCNAYDKSIRQKARAIANDLGFGENIFEGVFCMASGPMYETPAELRALKILGVDTVGMSMIPEVVVARHCGMKVFAFSLITNLCITEEDAEEAIHVDVLSVGQQREKEIYGLVTRIVHEMVKGDAN